MVEDDVARLGGLDRALLDVDRLVEVLEDAVEERERGLDVEPDAEQRPTGKKSRACSVVKAMIVGIVIVWDRTVPPSQ